MDWYVTVLSKYFEFKGRARRKEYWMFALFNLIVMVMLTTIGVFLKDLALLGPLYNLGTLIPSIAVGVRRMHDLGRSGWWIICPIVNFVFLFLDSQPGPNEYGPNPKGV